MELFNEYVKVKNTDGQIVKYIGSGIFRVRYMDGNITRVFAFREEEINFQGQDVDYLKKVHR